MNAARGRVVQRNEVECLLEAVERARAGQLEPADAGAPQRGEVTPDAERRAHVAGERTHIGAGRAADLEVDVDDIVERTHPENLEAIDVNASRRKDDVLAGPHPRVRPLAVDLDRADAGRALLDVADEIARRGRDVVR